MATPTYLRPQKVCQSALKLQSKLYKAASYETSTDEAQAGSQDGSADPTYSAHQTEPWNKAWAFRHAMTRNNERTALGSKESEMPTFADGLLQSQPYLESPLFLEQPAARLFDVQLQGCFWTLGLEKRGCVDKSLTPSARSLWWMVWWCKQLPVKGKRFWKNPEWSNKSLCYTNWNCLQEQGKAAQVHSSLNYTCNAWFGSH